MLLNFFYHSFQCFYFYLNSFTTGDSGNKKCKMFTTVDEKNFLRLFGCFFALLLSSLLSSSSSLLSSSLTSPSLTSLSSSLSSLSSSSLSLLSSSSSLLSSPSLSLLSSLLSLLLCSQLYGDQMKQRLPEKVRHDIRLKLRIFHLHYYVYLAPFCKE